MQGYKIISKVVQEANHVEPVTLFDLLNALYQVALLYRWSISDAELWPNPPNITPSLENLISQADKGVVWLSAEELIDLSQKLSVINWGAFLAFHPADADFAFTDRPYSEGRPPSIQHPKAVIEIQAVDGEYFEIFSRNDIVDKLLSGSFLVEKADSSR